LRFPYLYYNIKKGKKYKTGGNMKKILVFVFGLFCFFSFSEINKEETLKEIEKKYQGISEISGTAEMKVDMMGNKIVLPVKFWGKDKNVKVEMTYQLPGVDKPIEITTLYNGEKIIQYQKSTNTAIEFDLTRLQNFKKDFEENLKKISFHGISNYVDLEDGQECYILTIKNLQEAFKDIPAIKKNSQFFKKCVMTINKDNLLPKNICIYTNEEKPGIEISFKSLNISPINKDIFEMNLPKDAIVIDMTETLLNMIGSNK